MERKTIVTTLLCIWLFAIFAPPVVNLLDRDQQTIVVLNLNEEENKEGKKDWEQYCCIGPHDSSTTDTKNENPSIGIASVRYSGHHLEIVPPPPKNC